MSELNFEDNRYSKTLINFFSDFELERKQSDITLFDYLKKKEVLFKPKDAPKKSKEKIEELRVDDRSPFIVIGIAIATGVLLLAAGVSLIFIFPDAGIVGAIFVVLMLISFYLIYTGIRNALTNIIIFNDRLLFRRPLWRQKIRWREVVSVELYWKEVITKQKNFWGFYKETGRETVGVIMEFCSFKRCKKLDLQTFGIHDGGSVVTRILQYLRFYNPDAIIPEDFVKILEHPDYQLPGMSRQQLINHNIKLSYQLLAKNPGKALELAFGILILDDKNPDGWKLAALLLSEIFPVESFQFFDKAFDYYPDDPELSFAKGLTYEKLENKEKATELYLKTLERDPGHIQAITNYKKLTGEEPPVSSKFEFDYELTISKPVSITKEDISVLEDLISYEKKIPISDLITWSSWEKEKVIKIATIHLGFIVDGEDLVKDAVESKRRLNIIRIRSILSDKKEVDIEDIEALTKLPREDIIAIAENDLDYIFKKGKIKQKKKK
ncbi:MAG: tetratricopeptide repeat protein [Candidatus Heimdallarchaeota archaeon]